MALLDRDALLNTPSTLDIRLSRKSALFLWAAAAFILLSRTLTVGKYLPGAEGVNFALALSQYDLTSFQPHLPGYPVYILLARAFSLLGMADAQALALPGVGSAAFAVFPFFYLVRRIYGLRQANLAVVLYALHPGLFIASLRPGAGALLLFPFFFSLRMLLRNLLLPSFLRERTRFFGLYWGAACMGLLCGVEASAAVFLLPLAGVAAYGFFLLKRKKILLETFNGALAGFCLWAIPFFFMVPVGDLISVGAGLKSYTYVPPPDCSGLPWVEKTRLLMWNIFPAGFLAGFTQKAVIIPALALLGAAAWHFLLTLKARFKEWYLLLFILPWTAWSLFFRNLKDPSALTLLSACLTAFLAVGVYRIRGAWPKFGLIALLCLALGAGSLLRSLENRKSMPPEAAMAEFISRLQRPDETMIFCGSSVRQMKYLYPEYLSFGVLSVKDIDVIVENTSTRDVLVTSEVAGVTAEPGRFNEIARFSGPEILYGLDNGITLYRLSRRPRPF